MIDSIELFDPNNPPSTIELDTNKLKSSETIPLFMKQQSFSNSSSNIQKTDYKNNVKTSYVDDNWITYEDDDYVISIPDSFVVKEKGTSKFDKHENKKLEAVDDADTQTFLSITPQSLPKTTVYVNNHDSSAFVPLSPLPENWDNVSDILVKKLLEHHYNQEIKSYPYQHLGKNNEHIEYYKMIDRFTINNSPAY